ncbi:MAG: DNA/RNA nuclease SfsA [Geitlerinemataceae cyanobacterium]
MSVLVHSYPRTLSGTLVKRYKRFFVDVELVNGSVVTAHCPNTGPMTGISDPYSPVMIVHNDDPKRKLRYTLEAVQMRDATRTWVGANTNLPNRVIRGMLERHQIEPIAGYETVRSEVKYGTEGKSRVDFLLEGGDREIYVEVKNTTWSDGDLALFPDTVTTRGQKHLRELTQIARDRPDDARCIMLYFINRDDCTRFAPGDDRDPEYGQLLREAVEAGVEVVACRFRVSPEGLHYLGLAEVEL